MNNPIKALFNWLANTDTTREDNRKTFLAKMAELQKQIDQYNSNYEANMIQRQAKINEIYDLAEQIKKDFPQYPAFEEFDDLYEAIIGVL